MIKLKISKQKIEILQAARKMTATKLAELSGVTRQQISTIKQRGTCQPWTAQKLADAFGFSVAAAAVCPDKRHPDKPGHGGQIPGQAQGPQATAVTLQVQIFGKSVLRLLC